jgi:LCP family protein required for cell wall assembly
VSSDADDDGVGQPSPAGRGSSRRPGRRVRRLPRPRRPLAQRLGAWFSIFAVAVLVVGALAGYGYYRHIFDGINRFNIADLGKRPPAYNNAMNILVFGTDSRNGLTRKQQLRLHVGRSQGESNTDTIMLVHILPGRQGAIALSFPRDTQVPYYSCPAGPGVPGQQENLDSTERINAVFQAGGASCLWKTVEQQTGIHIDHVIELKFTGFVKIINDIGGVKVCVPQPVHDRTSGLNLHRGISHLNGIQALEFWRTREGVGEGDDPQRIQRDQFLMASLLQGITKNGLLGNPTRLISVVRDVAGAMTMDDGMTPSDLLQIAQSMRGLSTKSVQFITAPWIPDANNANLVDFAQPQADHLFSAIAHDQKLPPTAKKGSTPGKPATDLVKTAKPSAVRVEVLNGNGVNSEASTVGSSLSGRGFVVTGTGDATSFSYRDSVIKYASAADMPAVNALKQQLGSVKVTRDPSLTPGTLTLIVGSSYTGLHAAPSPSPSQSPQNVKHLSKKFKGITGSAGVCKDTSGFTGPLGY